MGEKPQQKHCCGERQKSSDGSRHAPAGQKPDDPAKCPCKDATVSVLAVPEVAAGSADPLSVFPVGIATFDLPVVSVVPAGVFQQTARFHGRSSSICTDDLLFTHHNLRC